MLVAHYIGAHRGDSLHVRLGWAAVRAVQRGDFRRVTHVESILQEHDDGTVTIASSSLRDGGVRAKRVSLKPGHWLIADVPQWDVVRALALLDETEGWPYDLLGAMATVLPTRQAGRRYFCSEWVATPFLRSPHTFGPAQLAAITMSIGRDVTAEFFAERQALHAGPA
jgi:hypothetical protein